MNHSRHILTPIAKTYVYMRSVLLASHIFTLVLFSLLIGCGKDAQLDLVVFEGLPNAAAGAATSEPNDSWWDQTIADWDSLDKDVGDPVSPSSQIEDAVEDAIDAKLAEALEPDSASDLVQERASPNMHRAMLRPESRFLEKVGEFQLNQFQKIRSKLLLLKYSSEELLTPLHAPHPVFDATVELVHTSTPIATKRVEAEPFGQKLTVKLEVNQQSETGDDGSDYDLASWLDQVGGHISVFLHPLGPSTARSTIFLDCSRATVECEYDTRKLTGAYQMIASIFTKNEKLPYGEITYPISITAHNAAEHLHFKLEKHAIRRTFTPPVVASAQAGAQLILTVFSPTSTVETASALERSPTPITNARVRIVGFPEYGVLLTDRSGSVKFSSLAKRSQYLLRIDAKGYLPSYRVIPVFTTHGYETVYLLPKNVESRSHDAGTFIYGKLFDPISRMMLFPSGFTIKQPHLPDWQVDSKAVPLLTAHDRAGAVTWSGAVRGFKAVQRQPRQIPYVFFARTGTGLYFELNRSGQKSTYGQFSDISDRAPVQPLVRLLGQDDSRAFSADSQGRFQIPDLGFASGVVSVQSAASGYPDTIHTLPFSTGERERIWRLPMVSNRQLDAVLEDARALAGVDSHDGQAILVGQIGRALVSRYGSLRVRLLDGNATEAPQTHGPFSVNSSPVYGHALRLSSDNRSFVFRGIPAGEYVLRYQTDSGVPVRSRIVHVLEGSVSVVYN